MLPRWASLALVAVVASGCGTEDDSKPSGSSSSDQEQELWQICQGAIDEKVPGSYDVTDLVWEHFEGPDPDIDDGPIIVLDVADGFVHTDDRKFDFECGVIDGKFDWLDWYEPHGG
jgi:hypothetical protein